MSDPFNTRFGDFKQRLIGASSNFFLGKAHDEKLASTNTATNIGQAIFDKPLLKQLSYPLTFYRGQAVEAGEQYLKNTDSDYRKSGLFRLLTRFRGQESRTRFLKSVILNPNTGFGDTLELVRAFTAKRPCGNSFTRLLQPKYYLPLMLAALKVGDLDSFFTFADNKANFNRFEKSKLMKAVDQDPDKVKILNRISTHRSFLD